MLYKATVSFSGNVSMVAGDIQELTDQDVIKDLLNAGYIIEYKADKKATKPKKKKGE